MNANELIDWLENHVCGVETTKEVIIMLRQLQAENEALKDKLKTYEILEIMVTEKLKKVQKK